ncbi:LuxR family transcriptional regulator [Nitratireductor sp.]|uniref:helix-turn-helix transcriptional regulator n=1 Tax=Nitratireductor sp. TaxID=1872084 RepID=UPI0026265F19|nr:LuxR family transcriptional regulator [Nitratireductor sp.]MCV0381715.1 LuxR family transcriptional regulator [Nitratireductor sp.]
MVTIEEFIRQTNAASSAEEVFTLFERALKEFGYDRICYSLITDHPSLGLQAGHGVLRNYSEDWMKHYFERQYEKIDPVPKFCFSTNMPFTWDWLTATRELSGEAHLVMNEANEARLYDGVAVPLYGANGELAGVGMASSSGGVKVDKDMLCTIRALAFQFHLAFTEKEAEQNELKNVHLTDREKEILLWAAEGKSDPVIADILNISYPTVRYHMNNIFRKLNANERTFAVVKAIRHGLILPSYVSDLKGPYQTR